MVKDQRLVWCGSTAWDWIGRRNAKAAPKKEEMTKFEFAAPHIYGPAAHINISHAITHCTSSHVILITPEGIAYTFGRNDKGQLGDGDPNGKARSDPFKIDIGEKVIDAATGRSHSLFVTESGKVYGCGDNKFWQSTGGPSDCNTPKLVEGIEDKVKAVCCGGEFSIALTEDGELISWGNPQYGQLGNGSTSEYIGSNNRLLNNPQPPTKIEISKKVVQIVAGSNHCHCLDEDGNVYSWGFAGFGRLGLNHSPPKDILIPTAMTGFVDRKNPVKKIAAGSECGMLIDSRDSLLIWGKWKNSGDGGQGTPWLYPKHFQGLNGWEVLEISAGANQLFALAENSCISWGQSCAHGELGHGENKPRSATNAVKVDDLEDFKISQVCCGLGHTLLVVDSTDAKFQNLPVAGEMAKPTGTKRKGSTEEQKKVSKSKN